MGCSPIKAVRELGLERRETVNIALSVNSAKCWKLRKHPAVPPLSHPSASVRTTAEVTIRQVVIRVITPDNQQERLDDYLAGYVDGEGSFHVAIQLSMKVIPFFRAHPILSEKRLEFETFAVIVTAMENREHLSEEGFHRLLALAVNMNGGGRYRRLDWSSRILRGHTPNTGTCP